MLSEFSDRERRVVLWIYSHAKIQGHDENILQITNSNLAKKVGVSRKTCQNALKKLQDMDIIRKRYKTIMLSPKVVAFGENTHQVTVNYRKMPTKRPNRYHPHTRKSKSTDNGRRSLKGNDRSSRLINTNVKSYSTTPNGRKV